MFYSQFDINLAPMSSTNVIPCLKPAPVSVIVSFKLVKKILTRVFIITNFLRHKLNEKLAWLVQCSAIQNLATCIVFTRATALKPTNNFLKYYGCI